MSIADRWYPGLLKRHAPRWSDLDRMGHSRILRSSYFWLFAVPVLAFLMAKTGTEIHIPLWKTTFVITLGLPFSWKIFYFSSVAFALASFVYSTWCPAINRDYRSFAEFHAEGKGSRQIVLELFVSNGSLAGDDVQLRKEFLKQFDVTKKARDHNDGLYEIGIPDWKQPDAFWWVRGHSDYARPFARSICAVFYGIGFLLLFVVVAQNFMYVWRFV